MLNATADEEVALAAAAHSALNTEGVLRGKATATAKRMGKAPASSGSKRGRGMAASAGAEGSAVSSKRKRAAEGSASAVATGSADAVQLSPADKRTVRKAFHEGLPAAEEGPLLQGFHFVAMEDAHECLLHELQPAFVILYDLDLAWIRQLEVYQAMHPERPVKARPMPVG